MAPITGVSAEGEVCASRFGVPPRAKLSSTWEMVSFMVLPLSGEANARLVTEIPWYDALDKLETSDAITHYQE
jgi:hypothetical protein